MPAKKSLASLPDRRYEARAASAAVLRCALVITYVLLGLQLLLECLIAPPEPLPSSRWLIDNGEYLLDRDPKYTPSISGLCRCPFIARIKLVRV